MGPTIWHTEFGHGPLVACAIHDGHEVRPEVEECLKLDEHERRYEEDPFTGGWTSIAPTRLIAKRSRFELDLNRPRDNAVYRVPADAWGLDVWNCPPSETLVATSLAMYDEFYAHMGFLLERLVARHGRVVVFDLHSYNHMREGRVAGDPQLNPEVNLGTRSMDRDYWAPVVDRWLEEMRGYNYFGRQLDVRENVKFFGGHFPTWIHENFPNTVCALAIEVKKFFMDELTDSLDHAQYTKVREALAQASTGVREVLEHWIT
jgi:N-formylglutamate amidohydrolase